MNIARLLAPIDGDPLAGFVAGLDPVNALADASDGPLRRQVVPVLPAPESASAPPRDRTEGPA